MKNWLKKNWPYIIIAIILLQTLRYKFTGHPDSVELFEQLMLFGQPENVGRLGVGITELLVSIGLFIKPLRTLALIGVIGLMSGALYFHLTILGFAGDNLFLSISALIALTLGIYLFIKRISK